MKRKTDLYIITELSHTHDGSITLSNSLVKELHLRKGNIINIGQKTIQHEDADYIFMFWNTAHKCFSFCKKDYLFASKAQCSLVAFNPTTKTYGFTALNPNIPYIYYHLNISYPIVKFIVEKQKINDNVIYNMTTYEIID